MTQRTMFAQERRDRILALIADRKTLTVNELCELMGVSPATVRSDLRDLHREGLVLRTHGGAMERPRTSFEQVISQRGQENLAAKLAIAATAVPFIKPGDTIVLDTGTTTLQLARQLGAVGPVTVLTNDLDIVGALESNAGVDVVLLGGSVRKGHRCTFGPDAVRTLDELRVDKAFVGTNSFSIDTGAMTPNIQLAQVKKAMIRIARRTFLLCDSSKLGQESFARFADVSDLDVLVTDRIGEHERQALEHAGIEVVVASVDGSSPAHREAVH